MHWAVRQAWKVATSILGRTLQWLATPLHSVEMAGLCVVQRPACVCVWGGVSQNAALPTAHLNTPQLICQQFCQKHPHSDLTSLKQRQNGTGKTSGLQSYRLEIAFTQSYASEIVPCPELHPQNQPPGTRNRLVIKDPRDAGEKGRRCFTCVCETVMISERNKEQTIKNSWTTLIFLFTISVIILIINFLDNNCSFSFLLCTQSLSHLPSAPPPPSTPPWFPFRTEQVSSWIPTKHGISRCRKTRHLPSS